MPVRRFVWRFQSQAQLRLSVVDRSAEYIATLRRLKLRRLRWHGRSSQFVPDGVGFQPMPVEYLSRFALFFPQDCNEQMFRAGFVAHQSLSLFSGICENPLALVGKRQIDGGGYPFLSCHLAGNLIAKVG